MPAGKSAAAASSGSPAPAKKKVVKKKSAPAEDDAPAEKKPTAKKKPAKDAPATAAAAPSPTVAKKKPAASAKKKKEPEADDSGATPAAAAAPAKKKKAVKKKEAEAEEEAAERYDDDFEEEEKYGDDFDDEEDGKVAQSVPTPTASPVDRVASRGDTEVKSAAISVAAENLKADESAREREEQRQQSQQRQKTSQRNDRPALPERTIVGLQESRTMSVAARRMQRGRELLKLVQFDVSQCVEILDVSPLTQYELYMQKYGRTTDCQAGTQTRHDDCDACESTEAPECRSRACQFPEVGMSLREALVDDFGGDENVPAQERVDKLLARVAHSVASARLPRFLRTASRVLELVLDENAVFCGGILKSSFAVSSKWASTLRRFCAPSYLINRPLLDVSVAPSCEQMICATYGPVAGDGFLRERGFVCVWTTSDVEKPLHVLSCDGQPTCACFASSPPWIVVAGTAEGTVVLWDLREETSLHPTVKIGPHNLLMRRPTYCSDAQRRENHLSAIVRIVGVSTGPSDPSALSCQFATVDEECLVNVWVAVQQGTDSKAGDIGLAPGGCVVLFRASSVSPVPSPLSATAEGDSSGFPAVPPRSFDLAFDLTNPNEYLVAADTGYIWRGDRFVGTRVYPNKYGASWDFGSSAQAATAVGVCAAAPQHFLAGYSDGTVRLFNTASEEPLREWGGFTKSSITRILWHPARPSLFAALDATSRMHLWDLNLRQTEPALTETFAKLGNSEGYRITSAQITTTSLLVSYASGAIDQYTLAPALLSPTHFDDPRTFSSSLRHL